MRYTKKITFYKKAILLMRNIEKKKKSSSKNSMRVRNAPEKITRRLNSSPRNKKRKAMNYKPYLNEKW